MQSFEYTITDKLGIHARPAGKLVKEAQKFKSKASVKVDTREADAKKIINLMQLNIKYGQTVNFEFEGEDEQRAAESLKQLCEQIL
jgi:phosphocarrier protein